MALKVAGYNPRKIFGQRDSIVGFDRQITTNDFRRLEGKESVLQCIVSILSTPQTKRVRDCEFGSGLYKYVYEPADEPTQNAIEYEVINALESQDERIAVKNVDVTFFSSQKGFKIIVECALPSGEAYNQEVVITPEMFDILGDEDS